MKALTTIALAAALVVPAVADTTSPLPWIDDDYPRALAQARAKKVPLFIEAWAPW